MLMNLLATASDGVEAAEKLGFVDGAFYAALGLGFVFLGILLLIVIFSVLGFIMKKINEIGQKKQDKKQAQVPVTPPVDIEEGISPEIVAAITAALAVYTEVEQQKCDFVVRKIRRV